MALPTTLKRRLVNRLGTTTTRATKAMPSASTAEGLFTIAGGIVEIFHIVGEVTTIIENIAVDMRLQLNPTDGTTTSISGDTDVQALPVGDLIVFRGVTSVDFGLGSAASGPSGPAVMAEGSIEIFPSATATGSIKWICIWAPIEEGGSVSAA